MFLTFPSNRVVIDDKRYTVAGRITYTYSNGCYWDEYKLEADNSSREEVWLEVKNGIFKLYKRFLLNNYTDTNIFNSFEVGEKVVAFSKIIFITNKYDAHVSDYSTALSYSVSKGTTVKFIEGISDGLLVSIEKEGSECEVFIGEIIPFSSLKK